MYWELNFFQKFFIFRYIGVYYYFVLICVGKIDYCKLVGSFIKKVFFFDFRFCYDYIFQGQLILVIGEVNIVYQYVMIVCDYS